MWEKLKEWRLAGADLNTIERREVLEDLFVFGKDNQGSCSARIIRYRFTSVWLTC
jgi:hypothetical protein